MAKNTKPKSRTKVKDLQVAQQELTEKDLKKVKGGHKQMGADLTTDASVKIDYKAPNLAVKIDFC